MMRTYNNSVLLIIFFAISLGCAPSSTISLNSSPSMEVLTSVESVNQEVQYNVSSKVEDPYRYNNGAGYEFVFPVNYPFNSHVASYMDTKYLTAHQDESDSDLKIDFMLEGFDVQYENVQNTSDFLTGGGDANVEANIKSTVKIIKAGEILGEKLVTTNSRYNERLDGSTEVQDVYERAANDAFDKHLIMIDNFISSLQE